MVQKSPNPLRVLNLENNVFDAELLAATLAEAGYRCRWTRVQTRAEFLACLDAPDFDIVLADFNLPTFDGLTALQLYRERRLDAPFVLVSGALGEEKAIEIVKSGATDYVVKDRISRLGPVVDRALREQGDIRRMKRAQAEAQNLVQVIEQATVTVLISDLTGEIIYANPDFTTRSGYAVDEALGKHLFSFTGALADKAWTDVCRHGEVWRGEIASRRKDGSLFHEDAVIFPIKHERGEIVNVAAVKRDITDSILARQALQASEARFRSIFENVGAAIWEEDFSALKAAIDALKAQGVSDFGAYLDDHPEFVAQAADMVKVLDVNEAARRLQGAESKQALLTAIARFLVPEEADVFRREIIAIAEGRRFFEAESRFRTVDGRKIDVLFRLAIPEQDKDFRRVLVSMVDITERKRAEQELERIFNLSGYLICVVAADGTILRLNVAWEESLGRSIADSLGNNLLDFVHPDDLEMTKRLQSERLDRGIPVSGFENRFRCADGTQRWLRWTLHPVIEEGVIYAIAADITESKRMAQIEDAVFRIAQAAEHTSSLDDLYPIVYENVRKVMAARNFYIALRDEPRNQIKFPFFIDEKDEPPQPRRDDRRGLTEYVLRHKHSLLCDRASLETLQRRQEIEVRGSPPQVWLGVPLIVDDKAIGALVVQDYGAAETYGEHEQRILEFVSSQVATTLERMRVKEALYDSERRFRSVVQTANDAIVATDSGGRVVAWNAAAERIFGYRSDEIMGKSLTQIMPQSLQNRYAQRMAEVAATGESRLSGSTVQWVGLRKTGEEFPLELSITLWKNQQKIMFTGVIRDITKRKQAEASLRQKTEALAQSNEELQRFARVASHEFQEPLHRIDGHLQWLERHCRDQLDEDALAILHAATEGTARMKSLLDDL